MTAPNTKPYKDWTPLERAQAMAQKSANRYAIPTAIYNLNPVGAPMYVVRDYDGDSPALILPVFYPDTGES